MRTTRKTAVVTVLAAECCAGCTRDLPAGTRAVLRFPDPRPYCTACADPSGKGR